MTLVDAENIVTLKVPPSLIFAHLPRMALTTLLRIHRISPSDLGDLSADLQKATENLAQGNADISVDFLITDQQVAITLQTGKQTKNSGPIGPVNPYLENLESKIWI